MTTIDIAWLAGIIEGEGSFHLSRNSPCISVTMTDEDVIKKVSKLFKRSYNINRNDGFGNKTQYYTRIYGTPAVEWLFTIYSFMGNRRKSKILEIINEWKKQPLLYNRDKFRCGHPKTTDNTYDYGGNRKTCIICTKNIYLNKMKLKAIKLDEQRERHKESDSNN